MKRTRWPHFSAALGIPAIPLGRLGLYGHSAGESGEGILGAEQKSRRRLILATVGTSSKLSRRCGWSRDLNLYKLPLRHAP